MSTYPTPTKISHPDTTLYQQALSLAFNLPGRSMRPRLIMGAALA